LSITNLSLLLNQDPMVARQPVVTTVYYEKPEVDNGKEREHLLGVLHLLLPTSF